MKSFRKLLGITALLAVMVLATGCVTSASIGGTQDVQGLLNPAQSVISEGATEIASYTVLVGILTQGYEEYAAAVRQAVSQGRRVSTVTTWYVLLTRTTAYAW